MLVHAGSAVEICVSILLSYMKWKQMEILGYTIETVKVTHQESIAVIKKVFYNVLLDSQTEIN
jgi:hypothetical protein